MLSKIFKRKKSSSFLNNCALDSEEDPTSQDDQEVQRDEISEETIAKIVTVINNSVLGLVTNMGFNVSNYCHFIERNFPINEEDWEELKEKILATASKGPKIHVRVVKGEINKNEALKLIAFIKHLPSGEAVSREILGTVTRLPDENVFELEDSLQLPSLHDCALRIEVRKVKNGEILRTKGPVGFTEIPLETIPSSIENYYHLTREKKMSFSTSQENFGHILLNMRRDFSEEDPDLSVPNILTTHFLKRLSKVLNKDVAQSEGAARPEVSHWVTAISNTVKSQSHQVPHQKLITKARSEAVEDQSKFKVNCILSDEVELRMEGRGSPGRSPSKVSPAMSPSQSMMSLLSVDRDRDRERRPSPHRLERVKDSLNSLGLTTRKKIEPTRFNVSKLLPCLCQHKLSHQTLSGQTDVSWDVGLSVSSEVLLSLEELETLHQHFILKTIEEHAGGNFNGKLSNTDGSILNILTGFTKASSQEVEQMISHSFISSYNKVPFAFNHDVISKHINTFSKTGDKTEAVNQFAESMLKTFEKHKHVDDESLTFALKNLKILKDNNMVDVQQITESVCKRIETEFFDSQKAMENEPKLEFCRNFLISYVIKEIVREDNKIYQKLFEGVLDYQLVTGDKFLSLCETLIRSHLPAEVRVPLTYSEQDSRVKELLQVLDSFYNIRRIWKIVHPTEKMPQWIFDLYQDYSEVWIDLAILKADEKFKHLKTNMLQKRSEFQSAQDARVLYRRESQEENSMLLVILNIIESCWVFREDLGWLDIEVNLRTGIKLVKGLSRSENTMLKLLEEIHLADEEYDAHELATSLNLISALLKRHDQTILEIEKLHQEIASTCSDSDKEYGADVASYKKQMVVCFEEIESIRTTLKSKIDHEIQFYANRRRAKMTDFINAKEFINYDDDESPTLMKWLIDEECKMISKEVTNKRRRSQIILALWTVMEEEIQKKLDHKTERNKVKNKPSRFYILKEALKIMIESKTNMNDDGIILDLELERLDKMLREVLVLSEDTNTLISKVMRKKAEATVVEFDDSYNNNESNNDSIKLRMKIAYTSETGSVTLSLVHVTQVRAETLGLHDNISLQVPLREEGKKTNIQLTVRLLSDNETDRHKALTSLVFKDVNTSYAFDLQATTPPVFQFSLDQFAAKREFADAFIVINIFHVNRAKGRLCLGECVIQVRIYFKCNYL